MKTVKIKGRRVPGVTDDSGVGVGDVDLWEPRKFSLEWGDGEAVFLSETERTACDVEKRLYAHRRWLSEHEGYIKSIQRKLLSDPDTRVIDMLDEEEYSVLVENNLRSFEVRLAHYAACTDHEHLSDPVKLGVFLSNITEGERAAVVDELDALIALPGYDAAKNS